MSKASDLLYMYMEHQRAYGSNITALALAYHFPHISATCYLKNLARPRMGHCPRSETGFPSSGKNLENGKSIFQTWKNQGILKEVPKSGGNQGI